MDDDLIPKKFKTNLLRCYNFKCKHWFGTVSKDI